MSKHVPVLLDEVLSYMCLQPGQTIVDATLGAGGYSRQVFNRIMPEGILVSLDRDKTAVEVFQKEVANMKEKSLIHVVHQNFSQISEAVALLGIHTVDGIVADLGISSDQLEDKERGLSFQKDGPLDMRLDQTESSLTAADIINTYSEDDLTKLLRELGEERYARSIVRGILSQRAQQPFVRTEELVRCVEKCVPGVYRRGKIHCATKVFMALRMEVNREIESLKIFLQKSLDLLQENGRLAVVTFHSIEDRIVKEFMRENARGCVCPSEFPVCQCGRKPKCSIVTAKPVLPSLSEVKENPRSRSAKLRVLKKCV